MHAHATDPTLDSNLDTDLDSNAFFRWQKPTLALSLRRPRVY